MRRIELPDAWRSRAIVIEDAVLSDDWFTAGELATAARFRLPKRRTEWKRSRIAAKQLAMDLGLCASPRECTIDRRDVIPSAGEREESGGVAPHPDSSPSSRLGMTFTTLRARGVTRHVSISHSGPYAAAAIDSEPVGVDIERFRNLSPSAAHFFLTADEAAAMRSTPIPYAIIHFWAAKEAAWKKRGGSVETLKHVPLRLEAETASGLRFDDVETFVTGDLVVALTRPSGATGSSRR